VSVAKVSADSLENLSRALSYLKHIFKTFQDTF